MGLWKFSEKKVQIFLVSYLNPGSNYFMIKPIHNLLSISMVHITICERGSDSFCSWQLEVWKNVGNQWSMSKNLLQISLEKYTFSERWRSLLSENTYFPRPIRKWFLVTLHWFPAFSQTSSRQLQHESLNRPSVCPFVYTLTAEPFDLRQRLTITSPRRLCVCL